MATRSILGNFLLFQLGWFAIVLSAAALMPWLGVAVAAAIVGFHLLRAPRRQAEAGLILIALALGAAWDSLLVALGWLHYPAGMMQLWAAPYWIIALWGLFATTLNVSLRWLRGRTLIAAAAGAVGGPLAFFAGERLGAVTMPDMPIALLVLAFGWAVLTPLLVMVAQRYDGFVKC